MPAEGAGSLHQRLKAPSHPLPAQPECKRAHRALGAGPRGTRPHPAAHTPAARARRPPRSSARRGARAAPCRCVDPPRCTSGRVWRGRPCSRGGAAARRCPASPPTCAAAATMHNHQPPDPFRTSPPEPPHLMAASQRRKASSIRSISAAARSRLALLLSGARLTPPAAACTVMQASTCPLAGASGKMARASCERSGPRRCTDASSCTVPPRQLQDVVQEVLVRAGAACQALQLQLAARDTSGRPRQQAAAKAPHLNTRGGCTSVAKREGCSSRPSPSIDRRTACRSRRRAALPPGAPAFSPPGSSSKSWPTRAVRPPRRDICRAGRGTGRGGAPPGPPSCALNPSTVDRRQTALQCLPPTWSERSSSSVKE